MSNKLSLIVKYVAKKDCLLEAQNKLIEVMKEIKEEEGCLQFELLVSQSSSDTFYIYETWANRGLWMQHLNSQHMIDFSRLSSRLFRDFSVEQLDFVEEEI